MLKTVAKTTAIATVLGSTSGLIFSALNGWDKPTVLALIGAGFGGVIGLVAGVLVLNIQRLRRASRLKLLVIFACLGAIVGALMLAPFSEGLAMATYLALEGAVAGTFIGGLLGIIIPSFLIRKN